RAAAARAGARPVRIGDAAQGQHLYGGAAHAARYLAAAAAVPALRGRLARLEHRLRVVSLVGGAVKISVTPVRAALASPMLRYLAILCVGLVAIAFFLVAS